MAIRGAKLTVRGGEKLGVQNLQGAQKAYKKIEKPKKSGDFFFWTVKFLYFEEAPFEFIN